jgi:pimeloyl-ACP methyl ester carboxylesterase
MKETIIKFGPKKNLLGIVSNPDTTIDNSPVAIMLNTGVINRVGPYQLHVDIARGLANAGFRAVRMDMSSFGDSAVREDADNSDEASLKDLRDAFDALGEKYGATKFVLIGLCSGAYRAHTIAHTDPRVIGLISMDGITFQTSAVLRYAVTERLLNWGYWKNQLRLLSYRRQGVCLRSPDKPNFVRVQIKLLISNILKKLNRKSSQSSFAEAALLTDELDRKAVLKEQEIMLGRGTQMLYIYSGGLPYFTTEKQFTEMFERTPNKNFQLSIYPNANHTFMLIEDRKALVNEITTWHQTRFSNQNKI